MCLILENGIVFWDFDPSRDDLNYFKGIPEGKDRILQIVSDNLKNEETISSDYIINAYYYILMDEQLKDYKKNIWYKKEYLERLNIV